MNESSTITTDEIEYGYFGTADYIVFAVMLAISTAIGIYFGFFEKKSENATEEYLLGGRKMKIVPIAISLVASQLSAISIIAIPSEMYTFGTQYFMIVPTMIFVVFVICYMFVPVFYDNHISNCYEYLEMRFSKLVRQVVTGIFVLSVYLLLPVIIFVPALAFAQVSGINIHLINAIVCCVCVLYTMLGGIKAVVWTDVVQATIMVSSCIVIVVLGVIKVGGFSEVWRIAEEGNRIQFFNMKFDLTTRHTFFNAVFGNFIMWTSYVGLNQSCVQRIVSVPTIRHARIAIIIFGIGFMTIMSLNIFTGIVMFARFYDCDPIAANIVSKADKLMPYFVQDIVGHLPGMSGVFISCVFSAALSTMSANLNSLSGIVYEDYVRPLNIFKHNETNANYAMKALVIITGVYCVLLGLVVEKFGYILQVAITIAGISQGTTLGVFTLGMLFPWSNKKGALCGTLVSLVCMIWLICGSLIFQYPSPTLPTSIENCDAHGINVTIIGNLTTTLSSDDSFSMYKISFNWFGVFGALIVWIIGVPVSFITGHEDLKALGPRLISPVSHWMIPKEAFNSQIELKIIDKSLINREMEKAELLYNNLKFDKKC